MYLYVWKRLTIFGEIGALFYPALVLVVYGIHYNGVSEKDRGSLPFEGYVHGMEGIHHLPFRCITSHIDTSKPKRMDCIRETNIHNYEAEGYTQQIDATIPFVENISEKTKNFKADVNLRMTEPQILKEPQPWEKNG